MQRNAKKQWDEDIVVKIVNNVNSVNNVNNANNVK